MDHPRAGLQYPRSLGEFQAWFSTDDACLDYLEWLRWPNGFVCPLCDSAGGWYTGDGRWMCTACGHRTSVTAGTIFHRTRTPLTVWFAACWAFASAKDGISALSLQRTLEIGSYETAWTMLHRLRSVLVRPGRERLTGIVEVDETFIGGEEQGLKGGRAKGKKVLVGVAIEVKEPKGFGRCRLAVLNDGSSASLHPFVIAAVEPGAMVITDAWQGYRGIERLGYSHEPRSQRAARARGEDSGSLLPGVHRLASPGRPRPGRRGDRPPRIQSRPPRPARPPGAWRGFRQSPTRRASHRLAGQAVAARHSPGRSDPRASRELLERSLELSGSLRHVRWNR